MGKADLHVHTRVSDGIATPEQVVDYAEHATDLDVIAVVDHEDVGGGLRAREHALRMGYMVEVIPGAEITTLQGHVVGLFIEETPASFRRIESTLEDIHALGGIATIPHPMSWLTRSVSERTLRRLALIPDRRYRADALEIYNPSPAGRQSASRAAVLNAHTLRLPIIGGSDAHHLAHIGTGWTRFAGRTGQELREAILAGSASGEMSGYPSLRETGLVQVIVGLGWGYTATPRKLAKRAARR